MSTTIKKRHREQTRHERQQNKEARRAQRKTQKPAAPSGGQEDPDLAGMVAGPQEDPAIAFTGGVLNPPHTGKVAISI
jgi:hypothetical protein